MKKKILVRGPALSQSGYGEQTRFALRALRSREDAFDIYLHPIRWGNTGWVHEDSEERRWMDHIVKKAADHESANGTYDLSLQVTIPNEWTKMAPVNVGYTAGIETTKISPQWVEKSTLMDEIIVVSDHAKYGFDNTSYAAKNEKTGEVVENFTCTTPVETVNYAVRDIKASKVDLNLDYDFNFLAVAQWGIRKNLENTISWFIKEFHNDEVGLVLKTQTVGNSILDKNITRGRLKSLLSSGNLSKYADRKCKIYLLHGDMPVEEIYGLYEHSKIKALVSIAHGEGFGLPIFEAAQRQLPVVTVGWGGQVDFLYAPIKNKKNKLQNKPHYSRVDYVLRPVQKEAVWDNVLIAESMWAYAHEGNYKIQLRNLYKNYGPAKKLAKNLQKHIREHFSEEKQYKKFTDICLRACGYVPDSEVDEFYNKMVANQK